MDETDDLSIRQLPKPRLAQNPGLDAVRAFAALGVVALHAGVPYLVHPMPGLIWPVRDRGSRIVDVVFWGIEVMIMPLFLMLAGFFVWHSASRLLPFALVKHRAKRLLVPLLFGILVVLPIDLYLWTIGLIHEGIVPPVKLKSFKFDSPISDQIWGLSHLWFLLYVFLYVCVLAVGLASPGRLHRVSRHGVGVGGLLLVASMLVLWRHPEVVWGFQHDFLPYASKWIYSGAFFAGGVLLAARDPMLSRIKDSGPLVLFTGVIALACAVVLGISALDSDGTETSWAGRLSIAVSTPIAATLVSLGIIGCSQYLRSIPRRIQSLAAASFWVYVIHHPLLGIVHMDLKWGWTNGSPLAKWLLSFAIATILSIASYWVFIDGTRFGRAVGLCGGRRRKTPRHKDVPVLKQRSAA